MGNEFEKKKHTVFMQNRDSLEMSGITEVGAFNEEEIEASSDWGDIVVKGSGLNIEVLDLEAGSLKLSGKIVAIAYSEKIKAKSFFKRVFS